jgi:hypothetical protein
MEMTIRGNRNLQKAGGIAALYLAASMLAAMAYFLMIAKVPDAMPPAEKLTALAASRSGQYAMTLAVYVIFGLVLVVLAAALYGRNDDGAEALMKVATPIAFIWAGLLVASGMIFNVGMESCLTLMSSDPAQAAALWASTDLVSSGLSGNGEIVGGSWMLLVSLAALKRKSLPVALNILGLAVAAIGILSVIPPLKNLAAAFGLGQIAWCTWLGIVLLRGVREARA